MHRFIMLAIALFAATPLFAADTDKDAAAREEARATIMFPWSETAKTADLKLPADGTKFINLWLDYCRNTSARRAKPSKKFMGNAHLIWEHSLDAKNVATLKFHADFVHLQIDSASLPLSGVPALFKALLSDKFAAAVKVDDDDDDQLRRWAIGLATATAQQAEKALSDKAAGLKADAWKSAKSTVLEAVKTEWANTSPTGDNWGFPGTPEAARGDLMLAISVLGGDETGPLLKKILEAAREEESKVDISVATRLLAQSNTKEGREFVAAELESEDDERVQGIMPYVPTDCDEKTLACVVAKLKAAEDRNMKGSCVSTLERIGKSKTIGASARKELLAYFKATDDDYGKVCAACGLLRQGEKDPAPRAFLEKYYESLDPNDGHAQYVKRLLDESKSKDAPEGKASSKGTK
ncbi:MAG: hypothetical protein IT462_16445 [Planctomycetes bacterium]|nr:hypothetical protein [Planctomycetota bacterium]